MLSYISAKEAAEKWNISQRRVAILCSEERIKGAMMVGNMWIIPANAEKPVDNKIFRAFDGAENAPGWENRMKQKSKLFSKKLWTVLTPIFAVLLAVLARHRSEHIAAVELHGRLVGKDFHESAACRFVDGCGKLYVPLRLTVQNPVVIISVSVPELLIVSPDPLPNGMRFAEIERCAGDIRNLSRRNQMPVDRGRMACIDHHDIVEYRSVADALEIEEGMV